MIGAVKSFIYVGMALLVCTLVGILYYVTPSMEPPREQKIGVLLADTRTTSTWSEAHARGIEKAAQERNSPVLWREGVTPELAQAAIDELAADGCTVIVSTAANLNGSVIKAAERYPHTRFLQVGGRQDVPNVLYYTARFYQTQYLAGIMAGICSNSGVIGYIAAEDSADAVSGVNAFTIGLRRIKPQGTVCLRTVDSQVDSAEVSHATEALLSAHPEIDILTGELGSVAHLDVAQRHGLMAIGCNVDLSEQYPETLITAPVWQWETFYRQAFAEVTYGGASQQSYVGGIDMNLYRLAETPLRKKLEADHPGMEAQIYYEYERIASCYYDVFFGPLKDNAGNIRVPEDQNLSDKVLFGSFDWYVEGVQVQ